MLAAVALPALLPLNRCQAPAFDCDVDPDLAAVEPVDATGRRLTADVLPEDDEVGLTPLLPLKEPALCTAGLAFERAAAVLPILLAERVMACLCWSNDTWFAELPAAEERLE
jgi:hypothetical protein